MIKVNLLKPFPRSVHIGIWALYFSWVIPVNVYRYGGGHLAVFVAVAPVMLAIVYLHRRMARRIFFRKGSVRHFVPLLAYFSILAVAAYLVLYVYPNNLSRRVLKDPVSAGGADYLIDVFTFFLRFASKGAALAGAEIGYNMLRYTRDQVKAVRRAQQTRQKGHRLRRWVAHFLGNLSQSALPLLYQPADRQRRLEAFATIFSYGIRAMARGGTGLVALTDEVYHLRLLALLYADTPVQLHLDTADNAGPVIPMLLLSLYKNMRKHGDFKADAPAAAFHVTTGGQHLRVRCRNKVAQRSAWIFEAGGTGLQQLDALLRDAYGHHFSMQRTMKKGMFELQLDILLIDSDEYTENHIKRGKPTEKTIGGGY